MKPIKVNYKNDEMKRTSTTINETIAWHLFMKLRTEEERVQIKEHPEPHSESYREMLDSLVQRKAQKFVNNLEKKDLEEFGEFTGLEKRDIEEYMMMEIRY